MTFPPPGATPVSIAAKPEASQPATAAPSQDAQKGGGSKVALIVIGVIVLAAAGVAAGWFFTQ